MKTIAPIADSKRCSIISERAAKSEARKSSQVLQLRERAAKRIAYACKQKEEDPSSNKQLLAECVSRCRRQCFDGNTRDTASTKERQHAHKIDKTTTYLCTSSAVATMRRGFPFQCDILKPLTSRLLTMAVFSEKVVFNFSSHVVVSKRINWSIQSICRKTWFEILNNITSLLCFSSQNDCCNTLSELSVVFFIKFTPASDDWIRGKGNQRHDMSQYFSNLTNRLIERIHSHIVSLTPCFRTSSSWLQMRWMSVDASTTGCREWRRRDPLGRDGEAVATSAENVDHGKKKTVRSKRK